MIGLKPWYVAVTSNAFTRSRSAAPSILQPEFFQRLAMKKVQAELAQLIGCQGLQPCLYPGGQGPEFRFELQECQGACALAFARGLASLISGLHDRPQVLVRFGRE